MLKKYINNLFKLMCPCVWWYTVTNMVTLKTVLLFLHDVHSIGNQFKLFYLYNYRVFYASTFSARDNFNNIHNLFYCSFLASQKYTMTSSNWCRWGASVYTFISTKRYPQGENVYIIIHVHTMRNFKIQLLRG